MKYLIFFIIIFTSQQKYEKQIDNITTDYPGTPKSGVHEDDSEVELFAIANMTKRHKSQIHFKMPASNMLDAATQTKDFSRFSLVPEEREKIKYKFVTKLLNDLVDNIGKPGPTSSSSRLSRSSLDLITPKKTRTEIHLGTNSNPNDLVDAEKAEKVAKEFMQKLHGQLAEEFKEFEQIVKSNLKLVSTSPAAENRRPRLHSSDDDEDTGTDEVRKRPGIKIENLDDTNKNKKDKHIRIRTSDEPDEKIPKFKENDKLDKMKVADSGIDEPGNILESDTKAGYSGIKRTNISNEYEPDDNEINKETKTNKIKERKTDKIGKEQDYTEKTEEYETTPKGTPSSISDDSDVGNNNNNKIAHEKEKPGKGPVKEEKDENIAKGNDDPNENGKKGDNQDTKDKSS